jgi:cytochrome c biogenesis protein CcdA
VTEKKEEDKKAAKLLASSRFKLTFSILLGSFLTFAGPTYVVYLLLNVLEVNYIVSILSGLILFIIGLALILRLIRNKALESA